MRTLTPAQRLSMTANLVIFLGLLYTLLQVLAFLGVPMLLRSGYSLPGLALTLGIVGVGYSIRYGSRACLYAAVAVFAGLTLAFATMLVLTRTLFPGFRLVLCTWALWRLWRAIPLMRMLQGEQAFPLPMSSYGAFFLRRLRARRTRRQP